jgi:hypothetical protein
MHTFKAPNGTVFHYNSDFSGEIRVEQFYGTVEDAVDVPVSDLLKFADHVRGNPPDRERIEFIRRAALHMYPYAAIYEGSDFKGHDTEKAVRLAQELWNTIEKRCAKPEGL